jgi:predicted nucleic acid-binding Zn ribbon protein
MGSNFELCLMIMAHKKCVACGRAVCNGDLIVVA